MPPTPVARYASTCQNIDTFAHGIVWRYLVWRVCRNFEDGRTSQAHNTRSWVVGKLAENLHEAHKREHEMRLCAKAKFEAPFYERVKSRFFEGVTYVVEH